ncbi:LysR substrate-binding domain-containing protein [Photobacterium halotolerans]|uniref:LysR substrate-binding domain-containing protein n=1 Tax=Photobacterium halotolerans TaxID=265726 RepID=UPI000403D8E0|nr:LysR substrate-binding domain-containing protein [Photobacterium halotolerans]
MISKFIPGTRALRIFVAAGKHLNFSAAAKEISLTPAAVSYQIKEMEEQLGFSLFKRNSRSIQLTPEGSILFTAVSESLDNMEQALGYVRRINKNSSHLTLSVGARFATYWLLPKLGEFKQLRPDLSITLDITDDVRDFGRDGIDMAIRFGNGRFPDCVVNKLFETSVAPVCSAEFLANHQDINKPEDLLSLPLSYVNCSVNGQTWPDWKMWMSQANVNGFDYSQSIAFSDLNHVIQAVQDNVTVGLVEPILVANQLSQGSFVQLFDLTMKLPDEFAYYFVYPSSSEKEKAVADFLSWLFTVIESHHENIRSLESEPIVVKNSC